MIFVRSILHFRGLMGDSLKTRASCMTVVLSWKKTPTGMVGSFVDVGGCVGVWVWVWVCMVQLFEGRWMSARSLARSLPVGHGCSSTTTTRQNHA